MLRGICSTIEKAAASSADSSRNNCNALPATAFLNSATTAVAIAHHPQPKPDITTLWVEGFDSTDDEAAIRRLFRKLPPIVCVDRPKDSDGNLHSYAFVTLLSQNADIAIETLNGIPLNSWTCLKVKKSNKKRKVCTVVVKRGERLCRAFRHGQCVEQCPFGVKHRGR